MIDRRWLFVCSCIALVTSAFTFSIRGDVLQEMGDAFGLSQTEKGGIEGAVFIGMALSMFFGGFVCDFLGMKRIMFLAFASHLVGSLGTIFAAKFLQMFDEPTANTSYYWLFGSSILMGCGNGFTEVGINPLIATLYPDKKTHFLNILHAWWPGGLVIGGLSAQFLIRGMFPDGIGQLAMWQTSLCLIALPAVAYGLMLVPARFPLTERVESGVSNAEMFKECLRPLFLIWAVCMLMTAATELGPQKWQESVMRSTAGVSGTLILVYTSGMMFVLRHFAGPIAHKLSPVGMLTGSAILAGTGLYLLSYADSAASAFGYATIFGLGIAYFWPTMLGVTAERFPKGGALALALMGSVGNLSISQVLPQMGHIVDRYAVRYVEHNADAATAKGILKTDDSGRVTSVDQAKLKAQQKAHEKLVVAEKLLADVDTMARRPVDEDGIVLTGSVEKSLKGAIAQVGESKQSLETPEIKLANEAQSLGYRMAFRWVSILPAALIVIFSGIILYDRARGGYRPEILISRDEENELFAGGVQGAVE